MLQTPFHEMLFPRLTLLVALAASAVANFRISAPSADVWWVAKSVNTLTWDCKDPAAEPTFTVLIANKDPKFLIAPFALIAIQDNLECSKTIQEDQSPLPPGKGYTIQFANPLNQSDVYTTSQKFEIKPFGSLYPTTTHRFSAPSATLDFNV
ncbi:hypothetical protein DXG01_008403 [Tephrocybe rancida]|nr:hypothetical protein DXG01_008403 [Tephrocybe rancida]